MATRAQAFGLPAVLSAVLAGDLAGVGAALAEGESPNTRTVDEWALLHVAAAKGYPEIVEVLLAAGAEIDASCPYATHIDRDTYEGTHTALLLALRNDHENVAVLLLDRGANPDLADAFDGTRAIHVAASRGLARAVERLVERGAVLAAIEAYHGQPALVGAIDRNHVSIALSLLAAGAPAVPSALFAAAYRNHPTVVARLLEAGVPIDSKEGNAIYAAAWAGHAEMVEWLLAHGASLEHVGPSALSAAANAGRTETVRTLLARDVPVNSPDEHGWTPLLAAAWQGKTETVRFLLSAGADLKWLDLTGKSALAWAREGKHPDVVAVLEAAESAYPAAGT